MKLMLATLTIFLVLCSLTFAQILASTTIPESFKNKTIISPDVQYLWNFQRGVEELYRFAKFTTVMRISYSLDLCDRRIGEMEVLISKNESSIVPTVEDVYELEIDKIQNEMNSNDIFSKVTDQTGIRENVTQRLNHDIEVLNNIAQNVTESKDCLDKAIKKTSSCIDFINKMG